MQQATWLKILIALFIGAPCLHAQLPPRGIIELNGMAAFEQTKTAFPPEKFTRRIPVPGLIDLAEPEIEQYDAYFSGTQEPRYSWYRFRFEVPERYRDRYAVLKIRKSRFDTQVLLGDSTLASLRVTGSFPDTTLKDAVGAVCAVVGIKCGIVPDTVILGMPPKK